MNGFSAAVSPPEAVLGSVIVSVLSDSLAAGTSVPVVGAVSVLAADSVVVGLCGVVTGKALAPSVLGSDAAAVSV